MAKWTEDCVERVGDGGAMVDEPSMEDAELGDGDRGGTSRDIRADVGDIAKGDSKVGSLGERE